MLAQVTLTPTESKKLIAKAVAQMEVVKRAVAGGMVVLHPSSSTYFVVEEILGQKPKTNVWVCGVIVPKAACVEMAVYMGARSVEQERPEESTAATPEAFRHSWVIKGGELRQGIRLGTLLAEMGPKDVYLKGVNALDIQGNVGVLIGNPVEGGSIGRVMAASKRKGFQVIFPVGLEKLIPVSIREAVGAAQRKSCEYAMGISCSLFPCEGGTVITEVKAVEILSGATAIPIAAGGLAGAEGAVTLVLKGDKEQVTKAIGYVEQSKGARLPPVRVHACHECGNTYCLSPVGDKHWAVA